MSLEAVTRVVAWRFALLEVERQADLGTREGAISVEVLDFLLDWGTSLLEFMSEQDRAEHQDLTRIRFRTWLDLRR